MSFSPQSSDSKQGERLSEETMTSRLEGLTKPTSRAQYSLWTLHQLNSSAAKNVSLNLYLKGRIDVAVLRESLGSLVRRLEILRTVFFFRETGRRRGYLVQHIVPEATACVPEVDVREVAAVDLQSELQKAAGIEFDLTRLPLFMVRLLKVDEGVHILQFVADRIILDESAADLFMVELAALYSACVFREQSLLPAAVQYSQFVDWELRTITKEVLARQLSYWSKKLDRTLPVLNLSSALHGAADRVFGDSSQTIRFPEALSSSLRLLSTQKGVEISVMLLSAFKVLLCRYTGVEDVVVGAKVNDRRILEHEGIIGPLDNMIALRTDLSGDPTFLDLLNREQSTLQAAMENGDVPFAEILVALHENQSDNCPLPFQVLFDIKPCRPATFEFAGLSTESIIGAISMNYPISISVVDNSTTFDLIARFNAESFSSDSIDRMLSHFQTLLAGVAAHPDSHISALPLMPQAERRRVLVEWNDTTTVYPSDCCIHEFFEDQVRRTPDAIAVIHQDRKLTYAELNAQSNQIAHLLMKWGMGPDRLVGISMERSVEVIIAVLGALKAGAACVPLDPTYPRDRLTFMLTDSALPVLLTQERVGATLPFPAENMMCIDSLLNANPAAVHGNPPRMAQPQNLSYVIYTSGSTGTPKGVALPHRTLTNLVNWQQSHVRIGLGDRVLQFAPLSFDVFFQEVFSTLSSGGTLVIPVEELRRDPAGLLQFLQEQGISHLFLPFVALQSLAEASEGASVPALREVITAGEQLRITPLIASFFENLPGCRLHNHYGPSETHVVTSYTLAGPPASWPMLPSIGRPIANTQVYILDQHLQPVPIGVSGELYLGGDCLARGYLNREELTNQKFVPDPFSDDPKARLYKTGDLARYASTGDIDFLGRADDQVKIRGFRVELGEVEAALGKLRGVQQTSVVIRQSTSGTKRLVAYVVFSRGSCYTTGEMRQYLKGVLPEYMVPASFVTLSALPLTSSGKINRRALPPPEEDRPDLASALISPRNPVELQLAQLWEKVLEIHPIGIRDNFFDLGAESLQAARLFARISKRFGKNLSPSSLFEAPTIEAQARLLSRQEKVKQWSCLVPIQTQGSHPPLFCVHGGAGTILFFNDLARHLGQDYPLYGFQAQGLYDIAPPHTKIEQMATQYVKEMRTIQPEGPYHIVGYCSGAVIAFDMVRQLEQEGHSVALLASINGTSTTYRPVLKAKVKRIEGYNARSRFLRYREISRSLSGKEKRSEGLKLLRRDLWDFADFLYRISRLHGAYRKTLALQAGYYRSLQRARPLPARVREQFFRYNIAIAEREYHPTPYGGRMVIFCGKGLYHDPVLGWGNLVQGGIEVHEIPGIHLVHRNIVEEPAVRELAEHMRACLQSLTSPKSQRMAASLQVL
jgi:amino acid adenylation domain-containing protein